MTFFQFMNKFSTEEAVMDYFINIRYGETVICPHCGKITKVYRRKDAPKLFICANCDNHFSIFKNTIFEKSSTDLRKWFYAIHLFLNSKKGISGLQLQREIGVTYKTAWRMLKQIRSAMGNTDMSKAFEAMVEIDETYIGGKPRKMNGETEPSKRGRGTKKTPVVGVKERSSSHVFAKVALPNEEGKKLTGKQLFNILDSLCKKDATVLTDDFRGYNFMNHKNTNKNNYYRISVNHSESIYSLGNGLHTNGIESFWALLKRGILGIYHHVSVDYLQEYVNEFCFRQNNGTSSFDVLLKQGIFAA